MEKNKFIKELERKKERFELRVENNEMFSFQNIFGNGNEVRLEIGSGRGEFLVAMAEKFSNVNFIGIDVKDKRIRTILRKLDTELHNNVRVCRIYVDKNVTKIIPENSIRKIYIIHPDPWPKRRHHRYRIIQHDFLNALNSLLETNGEALISTDHREYSEWIRKMFAMRKDFVSVYENGFSMEAPSEHVETYFEKMKKEEGFPPYFMNFKKVKNYDR
jgi:tRNA (guanine-N7-)-methyltransferase